MSREELTGNSQATLSTMPFVKTSPTDLLAVSINPKEHAKKAQGYIRQAKNIGAMATSTYQGASKLQLKQEIKSIILAAEHYRIVGEKHWLDSAHAYAQAAALISGAVMDSRKSAELYTEAAVVLEKVDTDLASEYYSKLNSQGTYRFAYAFPNPATARKIYFTAL